MSIVVVKFLISALITYENEKDLPILCYAGMYAG